MSHACRACEWSVSEAGRKSGGTGVAENVERVAENAEREVAEWGRSGERAESAAYSQLTVGRERGDRFLLTTSVVFM